MEGRKRTKLKQMINLLTGKIFIVAFLLLVQLAVLFALFYYLSENFAVVYAVLTIGSAALVIWIVNKEENPAYKLAWVIPVMLVPLFGALLYVVFGNKSMPKSVAGKIHTVEQERCRQMQTDEEAADKLQERNPQLATIGRYVLGTAGAPVWEHTETQYFPLGELMWKSMLEELEKAEKFIFMEFFIIEEGVMWAPIFEILKKKAASGVEVRVLYDDIGSIKTVPVIFDRYIRSFGIACRKFNSFKAHLNSMMNYRDHRKIMVIDGNVGYCGGINIADEYINDFEKHGHWKDTGVLLRGDAVWSLTAMFLSLWNFTVPTDEDVDRFRPTYSGKSDGFIQPFGDSPLDRLNVSEEVYLHIINRATRYVYIMTPYLIIDDEMSSALQMAARSGVDVRILTPRKPDKYLVHQTTQSFYQQLVNAGVKIYEYNPGFVHAKMYVSDDKVAVVGTANMDYRSFYLHFECGVILYYADVVQRVRDDFLTTLEGCYQIPQDYVKHVSLPKRMLRAFLRLFAPML